MLYDTIGPALLATLDPDEFQATLDLSVHFVRPLRPGRVVGKGRVVHRTGDLAYVEARLIDADQAIIATAAANARIIPIEQAPAAV